jgi:hypothetical protein
MSGSENNPLLSFVENLTGNRYLKIEEDFGQGFVRLNVSEADKRQAKHDIRSIEDIVLEMLRNSRDAGASRIFIASTKEDNLVRKVTVIDDACGIPVELHEKIFEPRVTSKLESITADRYGIHGRGMALFSIRQVAEGAELVFSAPGRGSVFKVQTSTGLLNERKDQSTYPTIKYRNGEPIIIRGPHNIIRTVIEFNLDHRGLTVYLGSPSEILATMCNLCATDGDDGTADRTQDFKIWRCVKSIRSAAILADIAERKLGLKVSTRNAQRILSNRVGTLKTVLETINVQEERGEPEGTKVNLYKPEPLAKRISQEDLRHLAKLLSDEFRAIGDKYFIEISGAPDVRAERDCLKVTVKLQSKGGN